MMVYGDPRFALPAPIMLDRLRTRLAQTSTSSLTSLRTLLIQAGQWEQAWMDHLSAADAFTPDAWKSIQRATDLAAVAFVQQFAGSYKQGPGKEAAAGALQELASYLGDPSYARDVSLTVKIPEGFEFYALYPEQYILSTWEWLRRHQDSSDREALVIGIRSIGTTLSAVVSATLGASGWRAERLTVRPHGDPFARRVDFNGQLPEDRSSSRVLIVDEGPGLSGSSMAATGEALSRHGWDPSSITFLPGRGGEPGPAASPEVKRWWKVIPRIWTPLENVRWSAESLVQRLASPFRGVSSTTPSCECLAPGSWRSLLYSSEADWPAVALPFERLKYLSTAAERAWLWKFHGLGAMLDDGRTFMERAQTQLTLVAEHGFGVPPVKTLDGFVAIPWINGRPATPVDLQTPARIQRLGEYIALVSGPPLTSQEMTQAVHRLTTMMRHNMEKALGSAAAKRIDRTILNLDELASCPSYGDGRLSPHEWILTSQNQLLKTDAGGHDVDHTLVGRQPVLWDVAGAIVEWQLSPAGSDLLLGTLDQAGLRFSQAALRFYCLAYSSFCLGLTSLCAASVGDESAEKLRLQRAAAFYRGLCTSSESAAPLVQLMPGD